MKSKVWGPNWNILIVNLDHKMKIEEVMGLTRRSWKKMIEIVREVT